MRRTLLSAVLLALFFSGCAGSTVTTQTATQVQDARMLATDNPFAQKSELPYGIVDLSKIRTAHFKPALEAGMAQQVAEIEAIVAQEAAPTFENTIVALEKSGQLLTRTELIFFSYTNAQTNPELQAIEGEMSERLSQHSDAILLNEGLFKRIEAIYNARDTLGLDDESRRLVGIYYDEFVRAGARLSPEQKAEIQAINSEIARLMTEYGQNILKEMNDSAVVVDDVTQLDGLSESQIKQAASLAVQRGLEGKYVIAIQNTSIQPVLKSLRNRDLRKRIHEASISRGMRGNASDNREKALRLTYLRAKRAEILGFKTYADLALDDQMAKTVENVNEMLYGLVVPAKTSLAREAAELQAIIDAQGGGFQLEAYDWLFYAEQLRKQKFDLDDEALKPYFELDNVIENGVFYAAEQLYGLKFVERFDIPKYSDDIRIFEVFDGDKPIALFVGDYYARESKGGGAWMSELQYQSHLLGNLPIVENQINIAKPAPGEKTLLTFDEVTTVFHEFGHALHGMLSNVRYPRLSGTNVPRDFVEFPSQFNETWATHPDILPHYAVHYQTAEPIPAAWIEKLTASKQFNQGYATTEYLAAAILDQHWHQMSSEAIAALSVDDFEAIERSLLSKAGLALDLVAPRYRSTYFNHIFANSYCAGYYAYIWSEVIDADAEDWFKTHGLTRENGMKLRNAVLSRGFAIDPMAQYRAFSDRQPSIDPLLVRRGLK